MLIKARGAAGGGASDHGALTGLGDDDHTQYILASGSRALTGDWTNTGRRIRETGTAEVSASAPSTPVTGLIWLDTAQSPSSGDSSSLACRYVTADYTVLQEDTAIMVNTVNDVTITLPAGTLSTGKVVYVKQKHSGGSTITIAADTGEADTIDGSAEIQITLFQEAVKMVFDGVEWSIL